MKTQINSLSNKLSANLADLGLDAVSVLNLVILTLEEDLAGGVDLTSAATIPVGQNSIAEFRSRKSGVIAGLHVAAAVLEAVGIENYEFGCKEGEFVNEGQVLITARGNTQKILLAERSALNFLGHLSAIATLTKNWVDEVKGFNIAIRDTRKTTPLLRNLEKFAVRMGGGVNHRLSLSDSALIKDNHVLAAGGVKAAFDLVRSNFPDISVEVEVDSLAQLHEAIAAGAEFVLLDNMTPDQCKEAVLIANGKCKLEASGGLTLENAKLYAESGVNYLAVGALTHSVTNFDIGLDLRME